MILAPVFAFAFAFMPVADELPKLDPFVEAVLAAKVELDEDALADHPFPLCPSKQWSPEDWRAAARGASNWEPLYECIDGLYGMPEAQRALKEGTRFEWPAPTKLLMSRHIVNIFCIRGALAARGGDMEQAVDSLAEAIDFGRLLDDGSSFYLMIETSLMAIHVSTLEVIAAEPGFDPARARAALDARLATLNSRFTRSRDELRAMIRTEYSAAGIELDQPSIDAHVPGFEWTCRTALGHVARARLALRGQ